VLHHSNSQTRQILRPLQN